VKIKWKCKTCGHLESDHAGSSGPWSDGRYHGGECVKDSKSYPPYRVGGCQCYEYKKKFAGIEWG